METKTVTETLPPETITETETLPVETVTLPGGTETLPGETVTLPGETDTLPEETDTLPGETVTLPEETVTVPGETVTVPGETVTLPEETVTLPGETVTQPGETVTRPGETVTQPGETITRPGETVTNPGGGTTVYETVTFETIISEVDTVERTRTVEETQFVPTTIVETLTIPTSFFVTVTISETIVTTQLTTQFSTVVSTRISSVPVTITHEGEPVTVSAPASTLTEVSACPAPTAGVGGGTEAPLDPKSDLTWGCSPGYICSPPKPDGCNFWAGSPADSYVCAPENCVRAPPYYFVDWAENTTDWYPPSEDYYHLDPRAFGLSFDIFEPPEELVTVIHGKPTTLWTGNYASQTDLTHYPLPSDVPYEGSAARKRNIRIAPRRLSKRDNSVYPSVCYSACQNAVSESLHTGKGDNLCKAGSKFLEGVAACTACVAKYDEETPSSDRTYVEDEFEQFINFCSGSDASPTQGDDDDGDGPASQVTDPEVSTRSQDTGNTRTDAQPITSTPSSDASSDASSGGQATPTETEGSSPASPTPSETGGNDDGEASSSADSPSASASSSSILGDPDDEDDDGPIESADPVGGGSGSDSSSGAGGSGSGPDPTSSPGSGGSGGDGDDGDSSGSPGGSTPGGDGGDTGGSTPPDGTGDGAPPSSTSQNIPEAAGVSYVPSHLSALVPLLCGLLFIL